MSTTPFDLVTQIQPSPVLVLDTRPFDEDANIPGVRAQPARGPLVFTTWAALVMFLSTMPDAPFATILVMTPARVPAGTWDLRGAQVVGPDRHALGADSSPAYGQIPLTLVQGAILQNVRGFVRLTLVVESTGTPVLTYSGADFADLLFANVWVQMNVAGGVFALVTGTKALRVVAYSTLIGRGPDLAETAVATFVRTTGGTSSASILLGDAGSLVQRNLVDSSADAGSIILAGDAGAQFAGQPRQLVISADRQRVQRVAPAPWITPAILVPEQAAYDADGNGTIRQAWAYFVQAGGPNFAVGNTVTLTDGTTAEVFTAIAGASAGFNFHVGASPVESLQELCGRIRASSTLWTTADPINSPFFPPGEGCVIMRRAQLQNNYPDRMWGTVSANVTVLSFARMVQRETYAPTPGQGDGPDAATLATLDVGRPLAGWGSARTPWAFIVGIVDIRPSVWLRMNSKSVGSSTLSDSFTTDDSLVWSGAAPTTTGDAINRIAQALAGLLVGPIP